MCYGAMNLFAQMNVNYVKLEHTACLGKCPVYTISINVNGDLIYYGFENVRYKGNQGIKLDSMKTKKLFTYINKQKISTLPDSYVDKSIDLPTMNLTFYINKKIKTIKNCSTGPEWLTKIASEIDKIWNEIEREKDIVKIDGPTNLDINYPPAVEPEKPNRNTEAIFEFVEWMPEYPAGEEALNNYLEKNIQYPKQASDNKIEGKVIVNFIVNEDGSLSNIKLVRGIGFGCDEEAIRLIQSMPKWKPGKQNGKPVKVYMNQLITFVEK